MASDLDCDVETDCYVDDTEKDLDVQDAGYGTHSEMGVVARQSKGRACSDMGFVPRQRKNKSSSNTAIFNPVGSDSQDSLTTHPRSDNAHLSQYVCIDDVAGSNIETTHEICDNMIKDGAHVVFDWDNTLKLYNTATQQLSSRVSREFLQHLKDKKRCHLYIISAIRPSALNLGTILSEVDKLGLTDVFMKDSSCGFDEIDGPVADPVVVNGEYARKGNIIICGYDKAEMFLKLSSFNPARGDSVVFFDDEVVNVDNFRMIVPNSVCYLCE